MLYNEAAWIARVLSAIPGEELSPLVNLGSSSREFRERTQPHVTRLVFAPLEARGVEVIHVDSKAQDGVTVAGDIFDDRVAERLRARAPRAVLCSNMLEHVRDREGLAGRCLDLVPAGGHLIVTVPHSYPYHADPIDTMYRPTAEDLAALFRPHAVVESAVVACGTYREVIARRPILILRHLARLPFPFLGWWKWKRSTRKLYWLFHPYEVACVVIRKGS